VSRKAVHNWVEDSARPGRPVETGTEATVQRVVELIRANRRITTDSVATALGCSHGLAYSTVRDCLKFRKVCARWVPRELKDRQKRNGLGLSSQHLLRYADEGEDMLNRTVTGDESWVRHYRPESKPAFMQLKHPRSPLTKNVKVTSTPSARKVMLTVF
jgi:hypothetical protein